MTVTPLAVFTTVGSLDEARRIAREVVERRLAACAQLSTIESFYRWKGAIHAVRIDRIFAPYRDWVVENSGGAAPP